MKRIDLNLINVFYAVMAERSVTRAAQRLATTQPAVSNALRRLRAAFGDELFVRTSDGIQPTEKALSIWPEVQDAMDKLRSIAEPSKFIPAEASLTFNIAITDTLVSRVVPALAQKLLDEAPQCKTQFHMHADPASRQALERGTFDCAVGCFPTRLTN